MVFTGIIEEMGRVVALADLGDSVRISIDGPIVTSDASLGDSICVSGVCLTVMELDGSVFSADVMAQTLKMSALGDVAIGSFVNLERALTPTTRLGGHMVQGHVDATTRIVSRTPSEHWEVVRFELPQSIARYVAARGSIAIDGISLTVSELDPHHSWFEVSLIPTTIGSTTLGSKRAGETVNLESDILARHVERLMQSMDQQ
jgi:riboflavin synthase